MLNNKVIKYKAVAARPSLIIILYSLALLSAPIGESKLGRLVDALALGGDEGRDKLR